LAHERSESEGQCGNDSDHLPSNLHENLTCKGCGFESYRRRSDAVTQHGPPKKQYEATFYETVGTATTMTIDLDPVNPDEGKYLVASNPGSTSHPQN